MNAITKYIADDGMEFDTEEECVVYEQKEHIKNNLKYFDLTDWTYTKYGGKLLHMKDFAMFLTKNRMTILAMLNNLE
jgi:hypothetical protein